MENQKPSVSYANGQRFTFSKGQKVVCNGYPGTVMKVHEGQLAGMVDVRVPGGLTTVSASYPDVYPADVQTNQDAMLIAWTVRYGPAALEFKCHAENIERAIELCRNAHPGEIILGADADRLNNAYVYAWESVKYGNENPSVEPFSMQIVDQRIANGQLFVDIAPVSGQTDDIMSLSMEINTLPGCDAVMQCAHLHFDEDSVAMSIFKQGDKYILRPETDVTIRPTVLGNGEQAYILE